MGREKTIKYLRFQCVETYYDFDRLRAQQHNLGPSLCIIKCYASELAIKIVLVVTAKEGRFKDKRVAEERNHGHGLRFENQILMFLGIYIHNRIHNLNYPRVDMYDRIIKTD